jgi:lantibiotic biosynthesis protein
VTQIAPSLIHMLVNWLIRSAPRAHELVLYDLLAAIYDSQAARATPRPERPEKPARTPRPEKPPR